MVGSPLDIQCIVSTVSGVELSSVMISWMGPGGESITNDRRVTISPTTSSGNNYTSSLQFTYLMEGDEGIYTCNVMILETNSSNTLEIQNLNGMTFMHFVHSVTKAFVFTNVVPTPTVIIAELDTQIVGQPLELNCSGSIIRGVTSEVDIVWKSDGLELDRINETNLTLSDNDTSLTYMNTYTIAQLRTSDMDRIYYCEVVINSYFPVVANSSIQLNLTSKLDMCVLLSCCLLHCIFSFRSVY